MVSSLAQSLQDLSTNFRHTQSGYLKRKEFTKLVKVLVLLSSYAGLYDICVYPQGMKNREERSKHFFDSGPLMEEDEDLALYDKVRALSMSF